MKSQIPADMKITLQRLIIPAISSAGKPLMPASSYFSDMRHRTPMEAAMAILTEALSALCQRELMMALKAGKDPIEELNAHAALSLLIGAILHKCLLDVVNDDVFRENLEKATTAFLVDLGLSTAREVAEAQIEVLTSLANSMKARPA